MARRKVNTIGSQFDTIKEVQGVEKPVRNFAVNDEKDDNDKPNYIPPKINDPIGREIGSELMVDNKTAEYKLLRNGVHEALVFSRYYPKGKLFIDIGKKLDQKEIDFKKVYATDMNGKYFYGENELDIVKKIRGEA
jgi:hypothetical protein